MTLRVCVCGFSGKLPLSRSLGVAVWAPYRGGGTSAPGPLMSQGHVASTPPLSPSNRDFVPFLLPLRLPLKIIPVFTPCSSPPSPTSSWSAADLLRPDPHVAGQLDSDTCITVRLTVASAGFGSAIRRTGPNHNLTSPGTVPRPPKAPHYPGIDFYFLFPAKTKRCSQLHDIS